jgi:hypothetical protein
VSSTILERAEASCLSLGGLRCYGFGERKYLRGLEVDLFFIFFELLVLLLGEVENLGVAFGSLAITQVFRITARIQRLPHPRIVFLLVLALAFALSFAIPFSFSISFSINADANAGASVDVEVEVDVKFAGHVSPEEGDDGFAAGDVDGGLASLVLAGDVRLVGKEQFQEFCVLYRQLYQPFAIL